MQVSTGSNSHPSPSCSCGRSMIWTIPMFLMASAWVASYFFIDSKSPTNFSISGSPNFLRCEESAKNYKSQASSSKSNRISVTESNTLYFPQNPDKFNEILLDCRDDPKCHLMYHHIPKTGGSLIASRLHPLFDKDQDRYKSQEWCCYEVFMDGHFSGNEEHYCTERDIGIFELWGNEFHNVLKTCQTYSHPSKGGHRYVALISTREPIQRTLSLIHQQCNSGYDKKNERYQAFCRHCQYDNESMKDSEGFFARFANETNRALAAVHDYMEDHRDPRSTISSIPFLIVDTSMLTEWFDGFQNAMVERHVALGGNAEDAPQLDEGRSNPENRTICSFGMTSPYIKLLKPSVGAYFDLWRESQ